MKRVLVFLLLCGICFASGKPIFVKDKFFKNIIYIYTPADDTGTYWCKWTLGQPYGLSSARNYTLWNVTYGKPYVGKWQDFADKTASENGVSNQSASTEGLMVHHVSNNTVVPMLDTQNDYVSWSIPDGHNRIHILFWGNNTASRTCSVTLKDGGGQDDPGLLISTLTGDMGDSLYDVVEKVLATNSTGTSRTLTITKTSAAFSLFGIIGIKTYNTSLAGDLTSATGGIATGHDIITTFGTTNVLTSLDGYDSGLYNLNVSAVQGYSHELLYKNVCELTIRWSADGGSNYRWTSSGRAHYSGTGNANFLLDAEPTLYIDGVSQGTMYDTTNVAMAELHEADSILIMSSGYVDWDNDNAAREAEDVMEIKLTQDFTKSGFGITAGIRFTGNALIDVDGPYLPSICIPTAITGKIIVPPDTDLTVIGSDYSLTGNCFSLYYDNPKVIITAQSTGPIDGIFESPAADNADTGNSSKKIYFQLQDALLDGAGAPVNGSIWNLGGFISIRSYANYFNLAETGGVIKKNPIPRRLTGKQNYLDNSN